MTDCSINYEPGSDESLRRRKNLRLPEYDYAQEGAYFITVCTHNKVCLFGDIVVMPNHVHGVLFIGDEPAFVGAKNFSPSRSSTTRSTDAPYKAHGTSKTIGSIVRGFKASQNGFVKIALHILSGSGIFSNESSETSGNWLRSGNTLLTIRKNGQ